MIHAPHVAAIYRDLVRRPLSFGTAPHEVDAETYDAAQTEMESILKARGWPMISAPINRPNFLLFGIPVCPSAAKCAAK